MRRIIFVVISMLSLSCGDGKLLTKGKPAATSEETLLWETFVDDLYMYLQQDTLYAGKTYYLDFFEYLEGYEDYDVHKQIFDNLTCNRLPKFNKSILDSVRFVDCFTISREEDYFRAIGCTAYKDEVDGEPMCNFEMWARYEFHYKKTKKGYRLTKVAGGVI